MSDKTSAAMSAIRCEWGAEDHIEDLTAVGGREFATHCLISYVAGGQAAPSSQGSLMPTSAAKWWSAPRRTAQTTIRPGI